MEVAHLAAHLPIRPGSCLLLSYPSLCPVHLQTGPALAGLTLSSHEPPLMLFGMEPAPKGDSSPQLKYELVKAVDQAQGPQAGLDIHCVLLWLVAWDEGGSTWLVEDPHLM